MAVVLVIGATLLGAGLKVLSAQLENSNYTNSKNKQELIKMVDGSWILSKEIEWIEKSKQEERDEKLNELLK